MESLSGSIGAVFVLTIVYVLGPWFSRRGNGGHSWRRRRISAAAGISVAYIFLDVLPELATHHDAFLQAAGGEEVLFAEQRIYLLALISFVVLYGLGHMVLVSREKRRKVVEEGGSDALYWLHLAGYAAYSGMIGYLLIERAERGPITLIVYTVAMAVHFLIVDHSLREEHDGVYDRSGHWVLAISVLAGWLLGAFTPVSKMIFARLFAVLAGGVVITSLRSELPADRDGKFWPFVIGAFVYAMLLLFA